jgi:hypothetical protein
MGSVLGETGCAYAQERERAMKKAPSIRSPMAMNEKGTSYWGISVFNSFFMRTDGVIEGKMH